MDTKKIKIAILRYSGSLKSAVFGLDEMFYLANQLCISLSSETRFEVNILSSDRLNENDFYNIVIIPPSIQPEFYLRENPNVSNWLIAQHQQGAVLSSACAGIFVLAATGLLSNRTVTTHWGLAESFSKRYPDVNLDVEKLISNDSDIVTAAGLMAWMDLGLDFVARYSHVKIMRQLGKQLIIDTGSREQKFYKGFVVKRDHGDDTILKLQDILKKGYQRAISVTDMANLSDMSERTLLRRFVKATGFKPNEYLQRLRVQKACHLLENGDESFDKIAKQVGYEDISACRKIFFKIMGLTPKEFKMRFVAA